MKKLLIDLARLSIQYYITNQGRINAKKVFAAAYNENPCDVANEGGCWNTYPDELCDGCLITQPLYKERIFLAGRCRALKNKETALIKKIIARRM